MSLFQILDWDTNFENNKSREREQCSFVCVPNKQHGMGFCRIMAEPDGAAIYGIWHCILGACSQQRKRDGWLTSDGHRTGTAWALEDLAIKFRRPENEIRRALEVLCSKKVKWILDHECPPSARQVPAKCPEGRKEGRKEEKGADSGSAFDGFWESYPKKRDKVSAQKAWVKSGAALQNSVVMDALQKQKRWPDWIKEAGKYIPYPATWLNGKRWLDEIGTPLQPSQNAI